MACTLRTGNGKRILEPGAQDHSSYKHHTNHTRTQRERENLVQLAFINCVNRLLRLLSEVRLLPQSRDLYSILGWEAFIALIKKNFKCYYDKLLPFLGKSKI